MTGTQGKMPGVGPLGRNLIANVKRLAQARGLSYRKMAAAMDETGRPIPAIGFSRIMSAERRVDVDELVALAAMLQVTPDVLLLSPEAAEAAEAEVPAALREARNLAARVEQLLAGPDDRPTARQVSRTLRRVQIEIEELLEETSEQWMGHQVTASGAEIMVSPRFPPGDASTGRTRP